MRRLGRAESPIRLLLARCLEKNQRTRLADISAALLLIEELPSLSAPAAGNESAVRGQIEAAVADARRALIRSTRWRVAAAGVLGLALAAPVGFRAWLAPGAAPAVVRTMVTTAGAASLTRSGFDRDMVITPDGTRIVYRGQNQ